MLRTAPRIAIAWVIAGSLPCLFAGCSHFLEARSIAKFTEQLGEGDLDGLRSVSSPTFKRKALRNSAAIKDLKVLNLPTEEPTVITVEDSSETEKRVVVQSGEEGPKLLYKLVREGDSSRWVVDDIFVKQKQGGVTATRSVTEQMDLLLTVHEFVQAWERGRRDEVLAIATPEFGQLLGELPAEYLAVLTRQVVGEASERSSARPEATVDHAAAIVAIPRKFGKLVATCRLEDDVWKVNDVSVESLSAKEQLPSVRDQTQAMLTAINFLDAYAAGDKQAISEICTSGLYRGSLENADFRQLPLPDAHHALPRHELRVIGGSAEFRITGAQDIIKLSLERPISEDDVPRTGEPYQVANVTLHSLKNSQERRLSAIFTAEPTMEIFIEALLQRDLDMLRQISTTDFKDRIWSRIDAAALEDSIFDIMSDAEMRIVGTKHTGAVTEITVMLGERPLTFVLHDVSGAMRIDDVLTPMPGCPESFKKTVQLLLPVRAYAAALLHDDVETLRRGSSDDFNRLVWGQIHRVPSLAAKAGPLMRKPLDRITPQSDGVKLISVGNEEYGAQVKLVEQHGRYVIDDVNLTGSALPEAQVRLKNRLRHELAINMKAAANSGALAQRPSIEYAIERENVSPDDARTTRLPAARDVLFEESSFQTDDASTPGSLPRISLDPHFADLPLE